MYRPLLIIVAFLVVTIGLILFQPDRSTPLADVPEATVAPQPAVEPAPVVTQATVTPAPSVTPVPAAPATTAAPAVEVTRAETPTLTDVTPLTVPAETAAPTATGPLFNDLGQNRPNFLTTTMRDENGTLRPSLLPLAQSNPALSQAAATDQLALATPPARVTPPVATTPATTPQIGNATLREQLAAVPTRAVHTVRLGDSLLTLSLRYYGTPNGQEYILEANRRHLGDNGSLQVGQLLRIPDIENL
ncbi:MAG: LysM peptidoglycan-binding domain-containing protein [Pseudomonadota bacterium]